MHGRIAVTTIVASILIVCAPGNAPARSWLVRPDGSGDAPTIQAAIDGAAPGDTILLAPGVYDQPTINCRRDSLAIVGVAGAAETMLRNGMSPPPILEVGEWFRTKRRFSIAGVTFADSPALALCVRFFQDVTIEDCIFTGNGLFALFVETSAGVIIRDNLFYAGAGGICVDGAAEITGNTIAFNGGTGLDGGASAARCNLIVGNGVGVVSAAPDSTFRCNDVYGNGTDYLVGDDPTGLRGNISAFPAFCAADPSGTGNFLLQSCSPCAPGNHPAGVACGLIGARPVGCGPTAVSRASWGAIKSPPR
ncbi:MAG: right-handed parallel beta-helix repeat-containing protein [Candidatus Krumholzibacteriota bacterium]|nr:right-handed parallel beta-helix repeat-containing protein [Candidatus Krumholzibacteriota bacterium]